MIWDDPYYLLLVCFWVAIAVVVYTYAGFPVLMLLHSLVRRRPATAEHRDDFRVSLIIAAHNEEDSLPAKLENVLKLRYPADRLEILIASDGSTDQTNAIVQGYQSRGVRLLALPRRGKAAALNAAVAASTGNILVFSDANSMYTPDAILELVKHFADEQIGGVAGNQVYLPAGVDSLTADGERLYWGLDRWMKRMQSRAGNVISATGAIYAIRRSLFLPVPEGVTDDFVTSTRVVAQGYRLVFEPQAIAYEPVAKSSGVEFGRKVRVMTRGLCGVLAVRELLNPFRHGMYSVQMFSHKVLRRLVALPLLAAFLLSLFLWDQGGVYRAAVVMQLAFYGLALTGFILRGTRWQRAKLVNVPFYFCLVNAAALVATANVLRGNRILLWEPQRHEPTAASWGHGATEQGGV
jgi:cellulose synthase/poly-beta-1,6-N-acetylglucosamine synthase-like glycosyltransferase